MKLEVRAYPVRRSLIGGCSVLAITALVTLPLGAVHAQSTPATEAATSGTGSPAADPAVQPAVSTPPTEGDSRPVASGAVAPGDIVVTARRRAESLERVPISITAFGAAELQQRSLLSETDLQRNVAGLTVRTAQTNNIIQFSIRGQSLDIFTGSQPAVLPYVNDVQISTLGSGAFYDLESIQTLKGPQGTLFGRNATGGAVLFNTAKPTNEFEGFATGRYGNYDLRQIQGAINIPIVDDKVLLRVAGNLERRDGYQYNIYQDVHHGRISREGGRASLTLKPFEGIENTTVFDYQRSRGDNIQLEPDTALACGTPGVTFAAACFYGPALAGAFGPGVLPANAYAIYQSLHPGTEAFPNGIIGLPAFQAALGPWKVATFTPSIHRARNWFVTNTTTAKLNDELTFKNIVGVARARAYDFYDSLGNGPFTVQGQDSAAFPNYVGDITKFVNYVNPADTYTGPTAGAQNRNSQWSEEAQIQGDVGGLNFIAGVYFAQLKQTFTAPVSFLEVLPFIPKTIQINDFTTTDKTKAIYVQATQDLSSLGLEHLKLTGGVRYTWEDYRLVQGPFASQRAQLNAATNPALDREKVKFHKPSWTIGLDYQATPDLLVYVAQRGSFRSGGINGQGPARLATADAGGNVFKSETTYDVELGTKYNGRLADVPFRVNLALYNQWIKNVQRVIYTVVPAAFAVGGVPALQSLTVNIPKARVRGIELDGSITPVEWLELGGSFTYTDAKYTKGTSLLFGSALTYGPYADTPKNTGTAFAAVTLPLAEDKGKLILRGDIYAQSGQYYTNLAATLAPGTRIPGYHLINARLDWRDVLGSGVSVAAFGKNLTKETNFSGGLAIFPFGLSGVIPGEPRTYGVEATVRF